MRNVLIALAILALSFTANAGSCNDLAKAAVAIFEGQQADVPRDMVHRIHENKAPNNENLRKLIDMVYDKFEGENYSDEQIEIMSDKIHDAVLTSCTNS